MKQQSIDFTRGEQLALIAGAKIPTPSGRGVSPSSVKFVLRTIDDFARGGKCWASQETIASRTDMSDRTVRRALGILEDLSLICVERYRGHDGKSRNHYTIVWSELALLQLPRRASHTQEPTGRVRPVGKTDQPDVKADQPDICADQPDVRADQPDADVLHNRPFETKGNGFEADEEETAGKFFFDDDQKALAQDVVDSINRVYPVRQPGDVRLVIKLGLLVAMRDIPEAAVWTSLEGLKLRSPRPAKPLAYLHRSIDNAVGGELNRMLSTIPESLLPQAARCGS
jgi:hypothetical protein